MRSNYKKLGEFIRPVDERNNDEALGEDNLYGISVTKEFIISHANLVGVTFDGYKVVAPRQFAYIPDTSRRGDKIAISLNTFGEKIIVSSICSVFEIIDENELLPEYLMLWFMRSEFDRYARFMSNGSAREVFDWDCMCGVELPVPPLPEQQKIVRDYQVVTARVTLLKKINAVLESQACTIILQQIGMPILLNKTNSEIEKLSEQYDISSIKDYCVNMSTGATPSRNENDYWTNGTVPWLKSGEVHNCCIFEVGELITDKALRNSSVKMQKSGTVVMAMYGATAAQVGFLCIDATTNQAICAMECSSFDKSAYLYFSLILSQREIFNQANGGAQDNLSKEMIEKFRIIVPPETALQSMGLSTILNSIKINTCELSKMEKLSDLSVAKMQKGA